MRQTKEDISRAKEYDFYRTFESGLKHSFEQIIDTFEPVCSNITSDAQDKWGWGHSNCKNTSPLPIYANTSIIKYKLDLNNLTSAKANSLVNFIVQSFAPYCSLNKKTSSSLELFCPYTRNLQYDLGGGLVASAHTTGSDIDPNIVPSFTLTYRRLTSYGSGYEDQKFNGNFANVYAKRRNFTLEKFNTVRATLKKFYQQKLALEIENPPDTGLSSTSDEFVPWFWESFGDKKTDVWSKTCDLKGGDTCTNLDTSDIWRKNLNAGGLFWRRLKANLLSGETKYAIDGFGNEVRIYPILKQCTNNDITTCSVTSPPVPKIDYFNEYTPPYTTALFINTCKDKSVSALDYCRMYISY